MTSLKLYAALATLLISFSVNASPVNINKASAKDIAAALSGIGTNKAQAIVEYRKQNGPFKKAADVVKVKGIGPSTLEKNKDDILIK